MAPSKLVSKRYQPVEYVDSELAGRVYAELGAPSLYPGRMLRYNEFWLLEPVRIPEDDPTHVFTVRAQVFNAPSLEIFVSAGSGDLRDATFVTDDEVKELTEAKGRELTEAERKELNDAKREKLKEEITQRVKDAVQTHVGGAVQMVLDALTRTATGGLMHETIYLDADGQEVKVLEPYTFEKSLAKFKETVSGLFAKDDDDDEIKASNAQIEALHYYNIVQKLTPSWYQKHAERLYSEKGFWTLLAVAGMTLSHELLTELLDNLNAGSQINDTFLAGEVLPFQIYMNSVVLYPPDAYNEGSGAFGHPSYDRLEESDKKFDPERRMQKALDDWFVFVVPPAIKKYIDGQLSWEAEATPRIFTIPPATTIDLTVDMAPTTARTKTSWKIIRQTLPADHAIGRDDTVEMDIDDAQTVRVHADIRSSLVIATVKDVDTQNTLSACSARIYMKGRCIRCGMDKIWGLETGQEKNECEWTTDVRLASEVNKVPASAKFVPEHFFSLAFHVTLMSQRLGLKPGMTREGYQLRPLTMALAARVYWGLDLDQEALLGLAKMVPEHERPHAMDYFMDLVVSAPPAVADQTSELTGEGVNVVYRSAVARALSGLEGIAREKDIDGEYRAVSYFLQDVDGAIHESDLMERAALQEGESDPVHLRSQIQSAAQWRGAHSWLSLEPDKIDNDDGVPGSILVNSQPEREHMLSLADQYYKETNDADKKQNLAAAFNDRIKFYRGQ